MKTTAQVTNIPSLETISQAITTMVENLLTNAVTVGGMIAARMETHPDTLNKLAEQGHNAVLLQNLYKVGLGELDPRLLIDDSPAAQMIRHLPSREQTRMLDEGLTVVVGKNETGQAIVKVKPASQLTSKEVKRVFTEDLRVRPVDEQARIVQVEPRHKSAPAVRYKISPDGETIEVLEKTTFTLSDWIEISERASEKQKDHLEAIMKAKQLKDRKS